MNKTLKIEGNFVINGLPLKLYFQQEKGVFDPLKVTQSDQINTYLKMATQEHSNLRNQLTGQNAEGEFQEQVSYQQRLFQKA